MPITRRTKSLAVALTAAGVTVGGAAVAMAAGSTVSATSTDVVITSTTSHTLPTTGGASVTVLTASVPAGKWVISASGDLVDYGASDYTRCNILVGSKQVAAVSTMVGDPTAAGNNGPSSLLSPFALSGGASTSGTTTVALKCWHDATQSTAAYVDPNATLVLHKTTSLQVATE